MPSRKTRAEPDIAKAKLRAFAKHMQTMRGLEPHHSPVPVELVGFVADALDRFLGGESRSLDAAFGLTHDGQRRSAVKARRNRRTLRAAGMRKGGKTWTEIENAIPDRDIDALRRDVRNEGETLLANQQTRRLVKRLTKRLTK